MCGRYNRDFQSESGTPLGISPESVLFNIIKDCFTEQVRREASLEMFAYHVVLCGDTSAEAER